MSRKRLSKRLFNLFNLLSSKAVVCGDFNSHNIVLGSNSTNKNGRILETCIDNSDLVLLNTGQGTRINNLGTTSAIDLSIVDPSLGGRCSWNVLNSNSWGSDHFPIMINISFGNASTPQPKNSISKFNIDRAGWTKFKDLQNNLIKNENVGELSTTITETIIQITEDSIPRRRSHANKNSTPWWNPDCDIAILERNKKLNRARHTHSLSDNIEFKAARAPMHSHFEESKKRVLETILLWYQQGL